MPSMNVSNSHDMKDHMAALTAEIATTSVEEFAATLKRDFAQWAEVIKDAGLRLN